MVVSRLANFGSCSIDNVATLAHNCLCKEPKLNFWLMKALKNLLHKNPPTRTYMVTSGEGVQVKIRLKITHAVTFLGGDTGFVNCVNKTSQQYDIPHYILSLIHSTFWDLPEMCLLLIKEYIECVMFALGHLAASEDLTKIEVKVMVILKRMKGR